MPSTRPATAVLSGSSAIKISAKTVAMMLILSTRSLGFKAADPPRHQSSTSERQPWLSVSERLVQPAISEPWTPDRQAGQHVDAQSRDYSVPFVDSLPAGDLLAVAGRDLTALAMVLLVRSPEGFDVVMIAGMAGGLCQRIAGKTGRRHGRAAEQA